MRYQAPGLHLFVLDLSVVLSASREEPSCCHHQTNGKLRAAIGMLPCRTRRIHLSGRSGRNQMATHNLPAVVKNFTGDVNHWLLPGHMLLHPGDGSGDLSEDAYAVVRWEAPVAGAFTIDATFTGIFRFGTTTDVHVVRNGVSLFDAVIDNDSKTYSDNIIVALGDTIDFLVGPSTNGFLSDSTELDATLTFVPEPSTLAMWSVVGFVGLLWYRRRRA